MLNFDQVQVLTDASGFNPLTTDNMKTQSISTGPQTYLEINFFYTKIKIL